MKILRILLWVLTASLMTVAAQAAELSQGPFASQVSAKPKMMIQLSRDHELFKKAYQDYTDLDGDGELDTTYKNSISYDGYFNPDLCYAYSTQGNGKFYPVAAANNHKCSQRWSGNFLNWATMTRIDMVRKSLYGGKRNVDSSNVNQATVLERAFLPRDIHAFAKVFTGGTGAQVSDFTPYSSSSLTLCSVSESDFSSANANNPPLIRVAQGVWPFWAMKERPQCDWSASWNQRVQDYRLGEFTVRTEVCDGTLDTRDGLCKRYPGGQIKPIGLLQKYGEDDRIHFGLVLGSYYKHVKGGVLRKRLGPLNGASSSDWEVDPNTGVFGSSAKGIIQIVDALAIVNFNNDVYSDCSAPGIAKSTMKQDGSCTNWGNPLGEMFLESLRYLTLESNRSAYSIYNPQDNDKNYYGQKVDPSLFKEIEWGSDPWPQADACSNCSVLVFSSGVNSFDIDELGAASSILGLSLSELNRRMDEVGELEGLYGKKYLVGASGNTNDQSCTPKTVNALSNVNGLCPDAPTLEGGYALAGAAYYARTSDLKSYSGTQTVSTYGLSLSEALPTLTFYAGNKALNFIPTCRARSNGNAAWRACSITDVFIVNQTRDNQGRLVKAKLFIGWEDSTWGFDYDMDTVAEIDICVGSYCGNNSGVASNELRVTLGAPYKAAGHQMEMGYTLIGSNDDQTHWGGLLHSDGGKSWIYNDWVNISTYLTKYYNNQTPYFPYSVKKFVVVGSGANNPLLPNPLLLAAKYGGFKDLDGNGKPTHSSGDNREWDADGDGIPDNYFQVRNFNDLPAYLTRIFNSVAAGAGSAAAPVSSSASVSLDTYVFTTKFDNTKSWNGNLTAFQFGANNLLTQRWDAATQLRSKDHNTRRIVTWDASTQTGIPFREANLTATQKAALIINPDGGTNNLTNVINYLRGDHSKEQDQTGGTFRTRLTETSLKTKLGDIVHSSPAYVAKPSNFYRDTIAIPKYSDFKTAQASRAAMVYVGANDGMLHAFDALTGEERFAYIPSVLIPHLPLLTSANYLHRYYVDGTPTAVDAVVGGNWMTVLAGGLRAGGKAIYALDITDPGSMGSESNVANRILFEYDEAADKNLFVQNANRDKSYLGYTFSQPAVVKLNDGKWALLFGNGYQSEAGEAALYVIYLRKLSATSPWSTSDVRIIKTGAGPLVQGNGRNQTITLNGLSEIAPVDKNDDGTVDWVYAGDLLGNLWKFDLTASSPSSWGVAKQNNIAKPLFVARDANNNYQPITARPEVARVNASQYQVYVGTGKYFELGDNALASIGQNTFYAIKDDGAALDLRRTSLAQQTYTYISNGQTAQAYRTVSQVTPTSSQYGWYLDLDKDVGEMVIDRALLRRGRIYFATLLPNVDQCGSFELGWLMALDALTGKGMTKPILDLNGDGAITDLDKVNGNSTSGWRGARQSTPLILDNGDKDVLVRPGEEGQPPVATPLEKATLYRTNRVNWREVYLN